MGTGRQGKFIIMKKILYFVGIALFAVSCTTVTKTAKTLDAPASLLSATVADLEISPERVSFTYEPRTSVVRGGMENVKQDAIQQLLEREGNNADLLVDPQFTITSTRFLVFNKIAEVTVSGHPAKYKNFHSLNDSVWCNRTFRYYYKDDSKRGGGLLNNLFGK